MSWSPTPRTAPASGRRRRVFVRKSDPTTATAMNTEPPRRYSADTADGSPMRTAQPLRLLVERVEADQQEQRREG
jgi:hypothetical protein